MAVWAIADLHLSFGVPNKEMDIFGPHWKGYTDKIAQGWRASVAEDDLVLIPGDISWAMRPEEVRPDLEWIDRLPGTKVFIKGNHDYWWGSLGKLKSLLPPTCHLIQNNSFTRNPISVAGARLWDIPHLRFDSIIEINYETLGSKPSSLPPHDDRDSYKIYQRELGKLETSLKSLDPKASVRIAMTHYPPIGPYLEETEASRLLEKYHVDICVFGHLHNVKSSVPLFGLHHGVRYSLVACDYLKSFQPLKICE